VVVVVGAAEEEEEMLVAVKDNESEVNAGHGCS
jgi:hypothetical protein